MLSWGMLSFPLNPLWLDAAAVFREDNGFAQCSSGWLQSGLLFLSVCERVCRIWQWLLLCVLLCNRTNGTQWAWSSLSVCSWSLFLLVILIILLWLKKRTEKFLNQCATLPVTCILLIFISLCDKYQCFLYDRKGVTVIRIFGYFQWDCHFLITTNIYEQIRSNGVKVLVGA